MQAQISGEGRRRIEEYGRKDSAPLVVVLLADAAGHTETVRSVIADFPGAEELAPVGDASLIGFANAPDALRFALVFQSRCPGGRAARIAVHLGAADDVGLVASAAAGLLSLAKAGQNLCSRGVFDRARRTLGAKDLKGLGELSWLTHGVYRLKGIQDAVEVCEVGERGRAVLQPPPEGEKALRHMAPEEEALCGWRPAVEQKVPDSGWVLKELLGGGSSGETWKAEDGGSREVCVLRFFFDPRRVQALKAQLPVLRQLKEGTQGQQRVAQLCDFQVAGPPHYLVVEYFDAPNLAQWVQSAGPLGVKTCLEIAAQVAEGVALVHRAGAVHNGIKPTSFVIRALKEGGEVRVKLVDFGLGEVGGPRASGGLGLDEPYAAPELVEGQPPTRRSDAFAVGVMLYQLCVGDMRRPLTIGWERGVEDRIVRSDLRWLLARDPSRRPDDAGRIALDLRQYEEQRRKRRTQRRAVAAGAAALAALVLWAGARVGLAIARQAPTRAHAMRMLMSDYSSKLNTAQDKIRALQWDRAFELLHECLPELRNWEWGRLKLMHNPELTMFRGHEGWVSSVAYSPDGQRVASGSWDRSVKVWAAKAGPAEVGSALLTLKGHSDLVTGVAFSPDGKRLASSSADHTVKIWDAQTGQEVKTLRGHTDVVWSASFSPDGKRLVSASRDKSVKVWDVDSGREILALRGHRNDVVSAVFSPDGKRIASASRDNTARVWDAESGKELMALNGHESSVNCITFSPDGKRIGTASLDKTAKVWDAQTGKEMYTLRGHRDDVRAIAFRPDGMRIATGSGDNTIKIWEAKEGVLYKTMMQQMRGGICSLAFDPEGKWLAAATWGGAVSIWHADAGFESERGDGPVHSVAFSPDGKRLVSGDQRGRLVTWEADNGRRMGTVQAHESRITSVAFRPDGKHIASASADQTVKIWDAETGKALSTLRGHGGEVASIAFSPDGQHLASGGADGSIEIWNEKTGQPVRTLKGHLLKVNSVAFSPDGRLASASADTTVKIWDVDSGKPVRTLQGHTGAVYCAAFDRSGELVASSGADGAVKLWNADTGAEMMTLKEHKGGVPGVIFGPKSKRVISCGDDHFVTLSDTFTGRLLMMLESRFPIYCLALSPNRVQIAAGDQGGVIIWDAKTWK